MKNLGSGKLKDLCLTFHCVSSGTNPSETTNSSLFVQQQDLHELFTELKKKGYEFVRPFQTEVSEAPKCAVTFDDGYYNNHLFLEVAVRHSIPLTLFLATHNIEFRQPYLWDLMDSRKMPWKFWKDDYQQWYQQIQEWPKYLDGDLFRPFSLDELKEFANNPLVTISPHSHYHQPLVGRDIERLKRDLDLNCEFIKKHFSNAVLSDFALPCGLLSRQMRAYLRKRFDRIYTIDGGACDFRDQFIDRISLISVDVGGPLLRQIEKSFLLRRRVASKIHRNKFLYL